MKVIFLDIDGVLCTDWRNLKPEALDELKRIVDRTAATLVLSSAWRKYAPNVDHINARFLQFGIPQVEELTPNLMGLRHSIERHHEIRLWLDYHKRVQRFAVIDDGPDAMLQEHPGSFFRCDTGTGLTRDIADRVIEWLEWPRAAASDTP